jgi:hypothetical protein
VGVGGGIGGGGGVEGKGKGTLRTLGRGVWAVEFGPGTLGWTFQRVSLTHQASRRR